jgi:hypothetical protein
MTSGEPHKIGQSIKISIKLQMNTKNAMCQLVRPIANLRGGDKNENGTMVE